MTTDPAKEVKRPSASREPTHNVYTELPAPSQPHNILGRLQRYVLRQGRPWRRGPARLPGS